LRAAEERCERLQREVVAEREQRGALQGEVDRVLAAIGGAHKLGMRGPVTPSAVSVASGADPQFLRWHKHHWRSRRSHLAALRPRQLYEWWQRWWLRDGGETSGGFLVELAGGAGWGCQWCQKPLRKLYASALEKHANTAGHLRCSRFIHQLLQSRSSPSRSGKKPRSQPPAGLSHTGFSSTGLFS